MQLLLLSLAQATSLRALVEVGDEGLLLRDAVIVEDSPRVVPQGQQLATLEIRDAESGILAEVAFSDPRHRAVIGVGDAVVLERAFALVWAPWPDEARTVTLGGSERVPRVAPPSSAIAVQESGPDDERLDLVYLGDGYTEDELDTFAADVDRISGYLLSIEPYGAYTGLFNIWRIAEASNDSGVSHYDDGQDAYRDTAYGCFYGCSGIDRLLCCDDELVLDAVLENVPGADGVMVLVNDPTYGGAGGFEYATSYTADPTGSLVAAHEIGHSLVGLWDEYGYGVSWRGPDGPNCGLDVDDLPWDHWLDRSAVDAFSPCSYVDYYRPTSRACMMNTLQDDYCPVCREAAVLAIYGRLPGMLVQVEPPEGAVELVGESVTFSTSVLGPDDGASYTWTLSGEVVGEDATLTLEGCGGDETLVLEVRDPTPWVRADPDDMLVDGASWELACTGDGRIQDRVPLLDPEPNCGCASSPGTTWIGLFAALLVVVPLRRRLQ
ncbi:MAG TPA: M64 family metallopeptidase [Myxococcota bacterium]|nr:M64 family metallopeptidase [Myxococcota bacterium]